MNVGGNNSILAEYQVTEDDVRIGVAGFDPDVEPCA
jgi:hypothetical protein